jgi:hypothetical protein
MGPVDCKIRAVGDISLFRALPPADATRTGHPDHCLPLYDSGSRDELLYYLPPG